MMASWREFRIRLRRNRIALTWTAVMLALDAGLIAVLWPRLLAKSAGPKDAVEMIGTITTALSVLVGAIYFFWQREAERRRQAVEMVREATAAIRDLPAGLTFLANNLTPEQTVACLDGQPFALTEPQRPAVVDLLGAECGEPTTGPASPFRLRRRHVLELQGAALNYLNILEAGLLARDAGLASPKLIEEQFGGFYRPDPARDFLFLGNFTVALRRQVHPDIDVILDDDPFALLARFGRRLHARRDAAPPVNHPSAPRSP